MKDGSVRNRQLISKVNITSLVKLFILHFLREREHYGNEIIDRIEICLNYSWRPSPGLIYSLLRNMEENLLIEGWWEEPDKKTKRIYRITDEGIRHYEKIKTLYKPLLDESLNIINNTLKEIYKN